jgi:hypothetical protein
VAEVVEHLHSKCEALISNPNTAKEEGGGGGEGGEGGKEEGREE